MKNLRKILYPFSLIYEGVMAARNSAYDKDWFETHFFDVPLIGVGNLSMGGTGKSPMTEYLIRLLKPHRQLGVLSRGYGRKTKGFRIVSSNDTPDQSGDEPLQFAKKFDDLLVAVDENRAHGISEMLKRDISPQLIVLDDVFQHRKVQPGLMILLSSYNALFFKDLVLPAGNLREGRDGAFRAHLIVVTKCPQDLSEKERQQILRNIKRYSDAPVFFSAIGYDDTLRGDTEVKLEDLKGQKITVVTGIAKPMSFIAHLKARDLEFEHKQYSDHHNFSAAELDYLNTKPLILTTEKDYMRLKPYLKNSKLFYQPIQTYFLSDAALFDQTVLDYVKR